MNDDDLMPAAHPPMSSRGAIPARMRRHSQKNSARNAMAFADFAAVMELEMELARETSQDVACLTDPLFARAGTLRPSATPQRGLSETAVAETSVATTKSGHFK